METYCVFLPPFSSHLLSADQDQMTSSEERWGQTSHIWDLLPGPNRSSSHFHPPSFYAYLNTTPKLQLLPLHHLAAISSQASSLIREGRRGWREVKLDKLAHSSPPIPQPSKSSCTLSHTHRPHLTLAAPLSKPWTHPTHPAPLAWWMLSLWAEEATNTPPTPDTPTPTPTPTHTHCMILK